MHLPAHSAPVRQGVTQGSNSIMTETGSNSIMTDQLLLRTQKLHLWAYTGLCVMYVCGTVLSMLSGLETRSLGLNTLGTT